MKDYVEKHDDGYWIDGKRISLDSVVYAYRRGQSPESIQQSFPLLTLEEIYGAITFYLSHQEEVDMSILEDEIEFEKMREQTRKDHRDWYAKMTKAREELLARR